MSLLADELLRTTPPRRPRTLRLPWPISLIIAGLGIIILTLMRWL